MDDGEAKLARIQRRIPLTIALLAALTLPAIGAMRPAVSEARRASTRPGTRLHAQGGTRLHAQGGTRLHAQAGTRLHAQARAPHHAHSGSDPRLHALRSPDLWATINLCSSPSKSEEGHQKPASTRVERPSIGIRGSMPPDGHPKDVMFMRFALQYLLQGSSKWHDLSGEAESGFVEAGLATGVTQAGRSFRLKPLSKGESFRLRGVIEFQWRHEGRVVLTATRLTTAGHRSSSGARPRGFSAATCRIG